VKFICDFMLGRLARWMRLLGYDTEYFREDHPDKLIVKAKAEARVVLTRNSKLVEIPGVVYIKSEMIHEQLRKVMEIFPPEGEPLSRCSLCNTPIQKIEKEKVKGKVPEYVYKTHNEFYYCPECDKIYWQGTHIDLMKEFLKRVG